MRRSQSLSSKRSPQRVSALRARSQGRVEVELDGEPWRALPAEVVLAAGLDLGVEIDRARARRVRSELVRVEAVDRAARALSRRALSAHELSDRLERAGVSPASRRETVQRLAETGAIDDNWFARERADLLARRGAGDALIRHDLVERGVSTEVMQEAIASLAPEPTRAAALAAIRGLTAKTARFLARKGFSEEAIEAAVGEAIAESAPPAVR